MFPGQPSRIYLPFISHSDLVSAPMNFYILAEAGLRFFYAPSQYTLYIHVIKYVNKLYHYIITSEIVHKIGGWEFTSAAWQGDGYVDGDWCRFWNPNNWVLVPRFKFPFYEPFCLFYHACTNTEADVVGVSMLKFLAIFWVKPTFGPYSFPQFGFWSL